MNNQGKLFVSVQTNALDAYVVEASCEWNGVLVKQKGRSVDHSIQRLMMHLFHGVQKALSNQNDARKPWFLYSPSVHGFWFSLNEQNVVQ